METLGSLVDKLTITQLKHYYADTEEKKNSTSEQIILLSGEIDDYMNSVLNGEVSIVEFPMNKVYRKPTVEIGSPSGDMAFGELVSKLAEINHKMWLNQEHVYNFEDVPEDKRVEVIDRCATLNVERNEFMDAINKWLAKKLHD